jgi:hypothetical protein
MKIPFLHAGRSGPYRSSPEPLQVGHVTSFFALQTEHGWWRTMSVESSGVPRQAKHGTVPEPLHLGHSIVVSASLCAIRNHYADSDNRKHPVSWINSTGLAEIQGNTENKSLRSVWFAASPR